LSDRERRGPASARAYVALALPLATVAYIVVQFVYLWEMERAGSLVATFDMSQTVPQTFTVHVPSLVAWLAIAAAVGVAARRVSLRLYEAQRGLVEERQRQAFKDPLTELDNRRAMEERLAVLRPIAERYGRPFSVISIDADGLKDLNDTYGHEAGDLAIRDLAGVLQATMRAADQCVRLGGDEFIVLLPDTGLVAAAVTAERLLGALRRRRAERPGRALGASAGVAEWVPGLSTQDVIRRADALLYEAKRLGKDRVVSTPPRPWTELLPTRPASGPHAAERSSEPGS
jgi:diguanylate cyclase (GGDEF)-like protein